MTYRYVAEDILATLKQVGDEREIEKTQAVYWIMLVANRLRKQHFEKHRTGLFISTFRPITVNTDTALDNRKYVTMPEIIFDMDDERAVNYITYNYDTQCCCAGPNFAQVKFNRTTAVQSEVLYYDEDSKPTPENPFFYRQGVDRLYLLGLECVEVRDVEVSLFTALNPRAFCNFDSEVPIPDDLMVVLKAEVMKIGRFSLLVPQERVNEAANLQTQIIAGNRGLPDTPEPTEAVEQ